MRIKLPPDLESALADAARLQGTTSDLLADAYLRERLNLPPLDRPGPEPKTLENRDVLETIPDRAGE